MSKRGFGKYFSLAAVAAVAAVAVKYLKDYTDFKEAAQPDLYNLKDSSMSAKDAAKRTYVSIKSGSGVKEAAGDLAKAAGRMAKDAGSVAMVAGKTTVDTVKDIKAKYDEDPEAAKEEVLGNFKDMKDDIADSISEAAEKLSGSPMRLRISSRARSSWRLRPQMMRLPKQRQRLLMMRRSTKVQLYPMIPFDILMI